MKPSTLPGLSSLEAKTIPSCVSMTIFTLCLNTVPPQLLYSSNIRLLLRLCSELLDKSTITMKTIRKMDNAGTSIILALSLPTIMFGIHTKTLDHRHIVQMRFLKTNEMYR